MITPKIWGPHFWNFFHLISLRYPEYPSIEDKDMMNELILSIPYILPCKVCREHFKGNIRQFPLEENDIISKESLITWFIDFHNIVNNSLKKQIISSPSAHKNILSLNHLSYWDCFEQIVDFIEYDIDEGVKNSKCQGIKKFIKVALYFSNKNIEYKNIKLDFYNHRTFKILKKNIFNK
jgi:hypothetical protein